MRLSYYIHLGFDKKHSSHVILLHQSMIWWKAFVSRGNRTQTRLHVSRLLNPQTSAINSLFSSYFQSYHKGIDGSLESGSIPAVQHPSSADPGSVDPAPPNAFLANHSRIWISGDRCSSHRCPCKNFVCFYVWPSELFFALYSKSDCTPLGVIIVT